ncbi:MAG: NAD(P)H-dependent oxidoreductase [Anaerolineales bacterium]
MKTLILDGSHENDAMSGRVISALQLNLESRGWDSEVIVLREKKIGNCAGDFFCWTRNPGVCNADDDNRKISERIMQNDLVVYLSPITFGGVSSSLKRMVDHQIQNILPFFTTIEGEVHHQKRYSSYPRVLTVGWINSPDSNTEAIFRNLSYRTALNMYAETNVCGVLYETQLDEELINSTNDWMTQIERGIRMPKPALPMMNISTTKSTPVRRALLLVGSPRTRKSTSTALGDYLFEQMNEYGVETQTIQIYTSINSRERMQKLYDALDTADLVVLAFPLYVDSLPAPVISALEKIATHRKEHPTQSRFAAISNCGFPEAHHTSTALAICFEFARSTSFEWMGSLALGGGQGLVGGIPLKDLDGRAIPIKNSLNMAAAALAAGEAIPEEARDLLAKPFIPNWLYRFFGGWGWKQQAKQYGTQKLLRHRPYEKQVKA